MISDQELLRQYADKGSEAAFAEVVRRHMDFVYSAARRMAALDSHLAKDITQQVFMDLARKARPLSQYQSLAGWLHRCTRFTALAALRAERRRRVREQEATAMQEMNTTPDVAWEQLRPWLDEAVDQLGPPEREAVLLRFFHGKSHREVGEALGLSENSANKRIERALEKLRAYFSTRGVTATAAILSEAISAHSVQAAPAGLVESVATASVAGAGGTLAGGALLAGIFTLLMKTKTKIVLSSMAIILLALLLAVKFQRSSEPPAKPATTPAAKPATKPAISPHSLPPTAVAPPAIKVVPAQVVAPTVEPVPVSNAALAPSNSVATVPADPRLDVGTAMTDFVDLLEAGDYATAADTYLQLPPNISGAQLMETLQQNPDFPNTVQMMINATKAAETSAPVYNDTGDLATYKLLAPTNGKTMVRWKKVDGLWHVDAFE